MDTSPRTQDTTLVQLPDVSLATLRQIVAQMQAERPDERDRIGRGLHVLLTAEIRTTGELGVYLVQSCQDGQTYYRATAFACGCPDRQRRERECKHSFALVLLSAARAETDWQRVTTRYELTAKGLAATEAPSTGLRVVGRA